MRLRKESKYWLAPKANQQRRSYVPFRCRTGLQLHSSCLVGEAEESAPRVFGATIFYFLFAAAGRIPHPRVQFVGVSDSVAMLRFGMARRGVWNSDLPKINLG